MPSRTTGVMTSEIPRRPVYFQRTCDSVTSPSPPIWIAKSAPFSVLADIRYAKSAASRVSSPSRSQMNQVDCIISCSHSPRAMTPSPSSSKASSAASNVDGDAGSPNSAELGM